MKQKKEYEYACDECDYHTIVIKTSRKVSFKAVVRKAEQIGWCQDSDERLICPSCIELYTGKVFKPDDFVPKRTMPKLSAFAIMAFCTISLAMVLSDEQSDNPVQKIFSTQDENPVVEETVDISPDLADKIAQDPEKFIARQTALPENEEVHQNVSVLASLPAKTAIEIKREIKSQAIEQDVLDTDVSVESAKLEPKEKPNNLVKKPSENIQATMPLIHGNHAIFMGSVQANLARSAYKIGLSFAHVKKLISIFAYNINFRRIAKGDSFVVVFDKNDLKENGTKAKILAAEFKTRGKTHQRFYYTNTKGNSAYYLLNSKGPSKTITKVTPGSKKGFLRYPTTFTRISSHYNPNRKHPITGRIRPHKGTDFAAPRGTKVWSTAEGKVKYAGWQKGYGRVVMVSHLNGRYTTVYAHLHKIASGIRKGKIVRQKQVLGYVGSTGKSTGNHLHYEFRVKGYAVNPLRVRLPKGSKIFKEKITDPKEQKHFREAANAMIAKLKFSRLSLKRL